MIVVRYTNRVKVGATKKMVEWLKSLADYGLPLAPQGERIYWHVLGPWDEVIWEGQFESLAQYQAWKEEQHAAPRFGEAVSKVGELLDPGGRSEVWNVVALG